ncbi:MAG TPA: C39 family peptidase [Candidatus Nanoarchaeia archaeon]|nr:C39 family peptidase [Candidatus Nanoarchaeia archaeon]
MIPYFRQQKQYTCGPATMRMVLASCGVKKSEKEVVKFMSTSDKKGTFNAAFPRAAERFRLNYVVQRDASIRDVKWALEEGYRIIIAYFLDEEQLAHYAVLTKIDKQGVHLLDPLYPKRKCLPMTYFVNRWHGFVDPDRHWFFGVKK